MDSASPLTATNLAEFIQLCRGRGTADEISQKELERRLSGVKGINQAGLSRWERGVFAPNAAQVRAIVEATGHGAEVLNHGLSLVVGMPVALRSEVSGGDAPAVA
jgi:transcriptional regulator with XRE-family HTH domain